MKLRELFRFEFAYQARRPWTWLYFAALVVVAFIAMRENFLPDARESGLLLNSPTVIAQATILGSMLWLLVAAAVAGDAAARDAATRMHPLIGTAPIRKAEYLGGRFLAAFALNGLILLAVPAGILLAVYLPGVTDDLIGPFQPAAYLTAYAFVALANALIATAIQFSFAALGGRAFASYLGSVLLFVTAFVVTLLGSTAGQLLDPIGFIAVASGKLWAGPWLANRLLWLGIALGALAFTHVRFRFGHPAEGARRRRAPRHEDAQAPTPAQTSTHGAAASAVPQVSRTFGFATQLRQMLAIAAASCGYIVKSWGGIFLLAVVGLLAVLAADEPLSGAGAPLLPKTSYVLRALVFPDIPPAWIIIPLLIVFWSGQLVWREREARVSEIVDAAPLPDWVLLLGKFLGLGLVLALCMALRMMAGMLVQVLRGYYDFEIGLYLQILFGIQLTDYLLLAVLAFVVHVVVGQKHAGQLMALVAMGLALFASGNRSVPRLLAYGSDLGWSYTEVGGFGSTLVPWLWFKLYWAAWAVLLAVAARLLWVRGREKSIRARLQTARRRFTPATAWAVAAAVGLILTLGGYIYFREI